MELFKHSQVNCHNHPVHCLECGKPIEYIFDPKVRNRHRECGGINYEKDFEVIQGGITKKT